MTTILIAHDPMAGMDLPPLSEAGRLLIDLAFRNLDEAGLELPSSTTASRAAMLGGSRWLIMREFMGEKLPDWWFRLMQCLLSTDIMFGPDYNDPAHGARLRREYPEAFWDGGLDFDIRGPVEDGRALAFGVLAVMQRIEDIAEAVKHGRIEWPKD